MKRSIAFLLLFASLLAVFAACAESPETPESEYSSAADESTVPIPTDDVPDDLKFNGEDVVILSRAMQGWTWDEVAVPELNSEPVNDAIFNRNITVGDRLNVNIVSSPIEDPDQFKPIREIERVVKAGSSDYDLVAGACYVAIASAVNGTFYDLLDLEYLDLTKEYWMQGYNDVISYGESQYTATGMIALSTYRFAFVTLFNKNLFDDKGVPYLYEAVGNNEWTLDYQAALVENFYQDLNGNAKQDEEDLFGLVSCPGLTTDAYWSSCDLPLIEKNADGEYEYVLDTARLSDAVDKILYLFYDCGGTYLYKEVVNNTEQDEIRLMFSDGRAAMASLRLVAVEQGDVRNMEQQYGIVPIPKYDQNQAEYGTLMHDQFTVFCVPASAEESKLELIGATLEVMASESLRTVKPAYYEIALKRKYMSDPVAWDMLDLIFANVVVDAGVVYGEALSYPHHKLRTVIGGKVNRVSSQFGKLEKNTEKLLKKITNKLERQE
ncbi:MAG: hypothetical protein IJW70_05080 [Clostridia bacterium]|nr:hypothetical protein [Clostridia bacterium]